MKLAKQLLGVPNGKIYPVQYQPGDECPPELEAAAIETGAFDPAPQESSADDASAPAPARPGRAARAK